MTTVLVTGSDGQLGSEFARLSGTIRDMRFILTNRYSLNITSGEDISNFFSSYAVDFCINCSAYTAVDKAEKDMENAHRVNAEAVGLLASVCARSHAALIHISTDYVMNGRKTLPYTEEDVPDPQSVYGKTKLAGERNALTANPDTIIIRTSWLYSSFGGNFVKTMIRLGKERSELKVVSDQVGSPTYAADLAGAVGGIMRHCRELRSTGGSFPSGVYNYSNEGHTTWGGFAQEIIRMCGLGAKVKPITSAEFGAPAQRPANSIMSKEKIKKTFGLQIPGWKDGLARCLDAIRQSDQSILT